MTAVDWKIEEISLAYNEINDFAIDDIAHLCNKFKHLKTFDLDGNLFFGLNKLRNLSFRLKQDEER